MGGVDLDLTEAQTVVEKWREEYDEIYQGWRTCHNGLKSIYNGVESAIDPWGLCKTGKDHIALPSGRKIWYPGLHQENVGGKSEWWYGTGRNRARIYAGKVDENIVQALARDVIADVVRTMWVKHKVKPCLLVHDEYVCIVRHEQADEVVNQLDEAMRAPTAWWPELIKWSESGVGDTYGQAH
jgi:hypothetical protein